jgi:hypothetical protein
MFISPCGWYAFELSLDNIPLWEIEDTPVQTVMTHLSEPCQIEIQAAQKESISHDDEMSNIHEQYLEEAAVHPIKTSMSQNIFGVRFIVTRGYGLDERDWLVGHAYWGRYCTFLQLKAGPGSSPKSTLQVFYDILNTLQPLI